MGVDQTAELIGIKYFQSISALKLNAVIKVFNDQFSNAGLSRICVAFRLKRPISLSIRMYLGLNIFFRCANNPFKPDPEYSRPDERCWTLKDISDFLTGALISLNELQRFG